MRSYLFSGDRVTVLADAPALILDDAVLIETPADLTQADFPIARLLSIWNTLPSVEPGLTPSETGSPLRRAFLWPRIAQRSPDWETETALQKLRRSDGKSVSDDQFVWGMPANRGPFADAPLKRSARYD